MRRFTVVPVVLLVLSALGIVSAPAAYAVGEPELQSSYPANNSSVQNSPEPPAGPVVTATFDVELAPNSTITVKDNTGTPLSGSTSFSVDKKTIIFTPSADLTEAGSVYEAVVVANRETLSTLTKTATFRFSVDNTPPAKPSIISVKGDNTPPAVGNDSTPTIVVGNVTAGDTVKIFDGALERGSKVVPSGATEVTFNAATTDSDVSLGGDGPHSLTATATDPAGNASAASTAFQYDLDTSPPAAPVIASVEGNSTSPVTGNDATPRIVVTGMTAGDTVKIFDGVVLKASKVAAADSVTFNDVETGDGSSEVSVAGDGNHTITAKAVDSLGNTSSASTGFVYTFDSTPPAAPTINSVDGDTTSPAIGADSTPTVVVGGVTAGDTVRLFVDGVEKGFKVVETAATTVTFNANTDADITIAESGDRILTAKAQDPVGNLSAGSAGFVYSLDTTGAAPQVVSTVPTSGTAGPAPATVSASYTEALNTTESTFTLANKNGNSVAGTVGFSGDAKTITFTPSTTLADAGSPYTATATVKDLEGNVAEPTVWSFTVDTTPPAAPVIASVHNDTTTPATGSDTTPAIRITGVTAGDTVKVFEGETELGSKVVATGESEILFNAGTNADVTLTGDGAHTLTAKAVDPVNNSSAASTAFVYNLDTVTPTTPVIASVEDDTTTPASGNDATPKVVVGSVAAGDTVTILDGSTEIASKVVPDSATTVTFNAAETDSDLALAADGAHVLTAKAADAAGNVSPASAGFTYTLDTAAPALVSTSPTNGSTVKPPTTVSATYGEALNQGTSTITVTKTGGGTVAGTTTFTGAGKTISFTPSSALTQADGPYAVAVVAKDAVGNATNSAFGFAVDTTAPAVPAIASVAGDTSSPASGEDATPTIVVSGVAAGDIVKIFDGGTEKGSKVVPNAATEVTLNAAESDADVTLSGAGNHTLTATAVDAAGNTSAASPAFVYSLIVKITPTVKTLDPASAPRDAAGPVSITGSNFTADAVVSFSGSGITVDETVFESPTSLTVLITIARGASLGARDVTVAIPGHNSATCVRCFTVQRAQGYTLVGADGGVFSFGTSQFHGSTGGLPLNAPIIGIAHTPTGGGYWLVAEDGGIFSYGDARFFGSMGGARINAPVLGMEPTTSGNGYWLFAADGGIFSFGDAKFLGSMGGSRINAPVVGMAATSTAGGYWLVAEDGGIFSFGNAPFYGSTGGFRLAEPVFDMAALPNNRGYWLVARDGGVFAFGSAPFFGSAVEFAPSTVIGMGSSPTGAGYWIADEDGFVYDFGDALFLGDLEDVDINAEIVGFAVVPAAAG